MRAHAGSIFAFGGDIFADDGFEMEIVRNIFSFFFFALAVLNRLPKDPPRLLGRQDSPVSYPQQVVQKEQAQNDGLGFLKHGKAVFVLVIAKKAQAETALDNREVQENKEP